MFMTIFVGIWRTVNHMTGRVRSGEAVLQADNKDDAWKEWNDLLFQNDLRYSENTIIEVNDDKT